MMNVPGQSKDFLVLYAALAYLAMQLLYQPIYSAEKKEKKCREIRKKQREKNKKTRRWNRKGYEKRYKIT